MSESRVKNSVSNIASGLVFRMASLLINFVSRTIFIYVLGEECLGLNGVFTSLLQMLSLAELGIGQAITFYLYKPIAEKDERRLASLVKFYRLCYSVIGCVIFIVGLLLLPFLNKLIKLDTDIQYNIYVVYICYLANTSITYLFFSYPQTVLSANQKQYVINRANTVFVFVSAGVEILILLLTKNYYYYLIARIIVEVLKNCILAVIATNMFPYIKSKAYDKITMIEIKSMFKDVYALFVVRLSGQLFNSTDNLFISAMFGTVLSGYNSNYLLIINALYGVISTLIYSLSGSIGNLYATSSKEKTESVFSVIDYINQFIALACTVCFFQLANPFISLFWGESMVFSILSVSLMSISFYIVASLYTLFAFRQAMGLFRYCIYNQFIAAIINIVLDYVLGKIMGISGLFLSTVIANLLIAIFPYAVNLYRVGFEMPCHTYIWRIIKGYFTLVLACAICWILCRNISTTYFGLLLMGIIAVCCSVFAFCLFGLRTKEFKETITFIKDVLNRFMHRAQMG